MLKGGVSRCFGFVAFDSVDACEDALSVPNVELDGSRVSVREC